MDARQIQQALNDAGYGPLAVDGILGPKTKAAIRAFQAAHGLAVDGIVGPQTTAALQGGAAPSSAGAAANQQIAEQFPQYAWAYNDPEIGPLLQQAVNDGWDANQLEAHVTGTNWFRSKTQAERNYLALAGADPKEAERRLNNYDSITKYIAQAKQYGQTVSFQEAARQVDRVVRGEIAPDALTEELRMQAKNLFGWDTFIGKQIDAGATVEGLFEPIRNAAAQVLGVNPASVDISDPKWRSLLQFPDGKGGIKMASDFELQQKLRLDPTYGFSGMQTGRDSAYAATQAVEQAFGFQGA